MGTGVVSGTLYVGGGPILIHFTIRVHDVVYVTLSC